MRSRVIKRWTNGANSFMPALQAMACGELSTGCAATGFGRKASNSAGLMGFRSRFVFGPLHGSISFSPLRFRNSLKNSRATGKSTEAELRCIGLCFQMPMELGVEWFDQPAKGRQFLTNRFKQNC